MHVHKRITVERPRPQVYAFWRNLTQLPQFMDHLASVQGDAEGITHWRAKDRPGASNGMRRWSRTSRTS